MKTELEGGRPLALVVGLGNPGAEYADHRHNVGFQVVDALARAHGLAFGRRKGAKAAGWVIVVVPGIHQPTALDGLLVQGARSHR
jgi:hypothetical protein